MDDFTPTDNKLSTETTQEESLVDGKVLYITPETKHIDYRALLGKVVQYVNMGDILAKIKAGSQYVVQIPVEFQAAYEAGELHMMQNQATGIMRPTLVKIAENGKHTIVCNLPVVEQSFVQGNPVQDIAGSYHNLLMQQQMQQISAKLDTVLDTVKRIEQNQIDDRFAEFESGKNALLLAFYINNQEQKIQQITASRTILTIAQGTIGQALKRCAESFAPLPQNVIELYAHEVIKEGYLRSKDREFQLIQEYYDYYLQATKFIAVSLAICGEMEAAKQNYQLAENFLAKIDFSKVKTIENIHKGLTDMFYTTPVEYLSIEKQFCLEEVKNFDYVELEVSGNKLLEVLGDGRAETVQESVTEQ